MENRARLILGLILAIGPVGLPAGAQVPRQSPRNLWAVVIGVENYDHREIPAAKGSRADAFAVYNWLRDSQREGWALQGLFHADEGGAEFLVKPDQDAVRIKPTHRNLTAGLRDWLRARIKPQAIPKPDESKDVVLIYFAGHAIGLPPAPETDDIQRDFLLPSDAQPDDWSRRGLPLDQLLEPVADDPLRDCIVLCWLDTGLAGRGRMIGPPDARPDSRLFLTRLVAWPGRSVWLAADGRPSGLTANTNGGLFTRALIDALGPPGKGPDEGGGLMGALSRLRANRDLDAQGFLAMGAIPRGLALREADLKPQPGRPDQLVLQRGHSRRVVHFALTADDQTLITGSEDSSIRLWKLKGREVYRTFADQFNGVRALALEPGGRFLISGDGVGNVRGYDVQRLDQVRVSYQAPKHTAGIAEIALLPPGKSLRFATRDEANGPDARARGGRVLLWELKDGSTLEARQILPAAADSPRCVRIAATDKPGVPACLIALDEQGGLQAFDTAMRPVKPPLALGRANDIAAIALNIEGTRAVVATDSGRLRIIDLAAGAEVAVDLGIEVVNKGLLMGPGGVALAMDDSGRSVLVPIDKPEGRRAFQARVIRAAWSENGRWLATTDRSGSPRLWRIGPAGEPSEVAIDPAGDEEPTPAASLSLGRGRLIAGDGQGGVRIWALPGADPDGRAAFQQALKPSRGRVQRVRVDREGNRLVALTSDLICWAWDLKADQSPRSLLGKAKAFEILADGRGLAVCREGGEGKGGRIELVDWQGQNLAYLEPPPGRNVIGFADVSVSPDGRWIAGRCDGNLIRAAQVVLWDCTQPGRPVVTIDDHTSFVSAAVFSADSKRLLTIDAGGNARVRDLANPAAPIPPGSQFELGKVAGLAQPVNLTAATFHPDDATRFIVGTAGGEVVACKTARTIQDQPPPRRIGTAREPRKATALTFARGPAGERWLGASFEDVALRLWKVAGDRFDPESLPFGVWQHEEQVNSLITWPIADVPMLVSGGDDGTVRFWGLQAAGEVAKPLIGTLAVWPRDSGKPGEAALPRDWIAYTPRGAFDGTPGGAQFLRRVGNRVDRVDQQDLDQARFPNLVERFTTGESPQPKELAPNKPPSLSIAEQSRPNRRSAIIRVGYDPGIKDLRLYQNGVPVPMADAQRRLIEKPGPDGQMSVKVHLRRGVNQFYAMASPEQPNTLEGRSDPIELRSEAQEDEGRLHLLALGVGDYARRKLLFATKDADDFARHFSRLVEAESQEPGEVKVLLDRAVTADNVRAWFTRVRKQVEDRPQDKVVIFLAGHTEVIQRTQQFALLPVTYPFRTDWPEVVSRRGPADEPVPEKLEPDVLAFATILFDLVRLQALDRLVIVDACQAESIFSDPVVNRIRTTVDRQAWPGRVAYMLATRRGESALEESKLEHGLMTYALLRGTGAQVPNPPEAAAVFAGAGTADLDGDREITIQELQTYVDRKLPELLRRFEGERERGPGAGPSPRAPSETKPPPVSFPLIRLPEPPAAAPR